MEDKVQKSIKKAIDGTLDVSKTRINIAQIMVYDQRKTTSRAGSKTHTHIQDKNHEVPEDEKNGILEN